MDCLQHGPTTPSSAAAVVTRLTSLHRGADATHHIAPVVEEEQTTVTRPSRWPFYLVGGLAALLIAYLGLVALTGGSSLDEHESPGEATVQVLRGRVRLTAGEVAWEGRAGDLLKIPDARHGLQALEDSAILLTVAKLP